MNKFIKITVFLLAICFIIAIIFFSRVDNRTTPDDIYYGEKIISRPLTGQVFESYADEIAFIKHVQQCVLDTAPIDKSIAYKSEREPRNLYQLKYGLCYDRSRVIEKILTAAGFRTRHIAVFKNASRKHPLLKVMDRKKHASHAVTEVLTRKGWLLIDSNVSFISINNSGQPCSIKMIKQHAEMGKTICWAPEFRNIFNSAFKKNFIYVYGLYSRHGKFYPPYNAVPDINWQEFYQNFTERWRPSSFSDHTKDPEPGSMEYPGLS